MNPVRYWFIDVPAKLVTLGWQSAIVVLAALTLLCYVNAALALVFYGLGIRLIWP